MLFFGWVAGAQAVGKLYFLFVTFWRLFHILSTIDLIL